MRRVSPPIPALPNEILCCAYCGHQLGPVHNCYVDDNGAPYRFHPACVRTLITEVRDDLLIKLGLGSWVAGLCEKGRAN